MQKRLDLTIALWFKVISRHKSWRRKDHDGKIWIRKISALIEKSREESRYENKGEWDKNQLPDVGKR